MNCICEPYLPIQFTNKVQKTADSWLYLWTLFDEYRPVFLTLFVNFIRWISAGFLDLICELYSMNICRFFEPYLWTLFDEYLPVFWTLFMNCIYSKNGKFMTLFMNFIRWIKTGRFIRWISAGFLNLNYELYLFKKWQIHDFIHELYSMNICRFLNLICELVFIRWISAGFLNLICIGEYSSQIQFTNKVQKTSRFLTCIYSMNIAKFLWKAPVK